MGPFIGGTVMSCCFLGICSKTLVFRGRVRYIYEYLNKRAHFVRMSEDMHHRVQLGGYTRASLLL